MNVGVIPKPKWLIGMVLALGFSLTACSSGSTEQPLNRAPFYLAVAELGVRPVAHYSGSLPGGSAQWESDVTTGGAQIGTVTIGGQRLKTMTVGGRTYVKPPRDLLPDLPSGTSASSLKNKWVTGYSGLSALLPQGVTTRWRGGPLVGRR